MMGVDYENDMTFWPVLQKLIPNLPRGVTDFALTIKPGKEVIVNLSMYVMDGEGVKAEDGKEIIINKRYRLVEFPEPNPATPYNRR